MPTTYKFEVKNAANILTMHSLKSTELRLRILNLMLKSSKSLTQKEIVQLLNSEIKSFDRISVYRNLILLKKVGVLHELKDNQYIACHHHCYHHSHVLLFCLSCKNFQEIEDHRVIKKIAASVESLNFFSQQSPITLQGICLRCRA